MKLFNKYYWLCVFLSFVYLLAPFVNEPNPAVLAQYGIARDAVIWINLSSALPFIFIWFLGFYALVKLREYAIRIHGDEDGKGFRLLSIGYGIVAIGIPIAFVISRWLLNASNVGMIPVALQTIVSTYLVLLVTLVSFVLITKGAYRLYQLVESPSIALWRWLSAGMALIILASLYTYLVFTNPSRELPLLEGASSYFMPDWLILTTVVAPYIAIITTATASIILLDIYRTTVGGTLYKRALRNITIGLIFCISALSISQFVDALGDTIAAQGLGMLLTLTYLALIVLVTGNFLIARGAKKLTKLEGITDV